MSKLSELQELVNSLTRKEKARILNALEAITRGSSNQQLDLYRALTNALPGDEGKALVNQLKPKLRKNLPTLMRRLYALILEQLGTHANNKEVSARLNNAINEVNVLYEKQLYQQAEKVLEKALKLAAYFKESYPHLRLIEWKRKLVRAHRSPDAANLLQALYLQQKTIGQEMILQIETRNLRDQALELIRNKRLSLSERRRQLNEICTHPILQAARYSKDMRVELNANATLGTCLFELGRTREAIAIYTKLLDLWEAYPEWINAYPEEFLEDFNLFQSMILRDSDRLDLLEKHTETIKKLPLARPNLQFRFKYYGFQLQIVTYLNFLEWEMARNVIREAGKWMETDEKSFTTSHKLAFLYNFTVFHFFQGEFAVAKHHNRQIIDAGEKPKRLDLRRAARLLNLVIYIEGQDYDYAEYQLRATREWLRRKSLDDPFSKSFFRLVQQVIDGGGADQGVWMRTQKETLENHPPIHGSNEIIIWLESKIRGTSLQKVCEELIPQMR